MWKLGPLALACWAAALAAPPGLPRYTVETLAGSGFPDMPPPAVVALGPLKGIAADRWGHVYIADTDHHRVCRLDPDGRSSTVAGTGYAGFSGDGGPATAAELNFPYGLALDSAGNLYIADFGNHRVRKLSLDGAIATVAGSGLPGFAGDGGPAIAAELLGPRNLAVDAAGSLYISEFLAHRVRRVAPDGRIATLAGTGIPGYTGDGGPARAAQLAYPAGLALDAAANLYVADSQNLAIRRISPAGLITTALRVSGTAAPAPVGLAVEPSGAILFTDANPVLRRWFPDGPVAKLEGAAPSDVAVDPAGALYLAEGQQASQLLPNGLTVLTSGLVPDPAEPAVAILAHLHYPAALALDPAGNLYVAESGGHRVRRIAPSGLIFPVAGDGIAGSSGDGAPALFARLDAPAGLAFDGGAGLLVADTANSRVRRVTPGTLLAAVTSAVDQPRGLAAGPAGSVFIADTGHHRVLRRDRDGLLAVVAGTGEPGDSGDGGPACFAALHSPAALAADHSGALYIADTGNHRIRRIDPDGVIRPVAPGLALSAPAGLALAPDGALLVADTGRHRILAIAPDGAVALVAGTGSPGFSGDGGPALAAQLHSPLGLAVDPAGILLVADSGNHRIRKLTPLGAPPLVSPGLVNAASLQPGALAPGQLVSLFAAGLLSPGETEGVVLRFDGQLAPVLFASPGQVNAQVPYEVAGRASTTVELWSRDSLRARLLLPVAPAAPGLFAAVLNQDGALNSASAPAARGSIVVLFATGEGQTSPPGVTGQPAADPLPAPLLPVSLTIAGTAAELLYAGAAPGLVGLMQINARLPAGFSPAGAVPVVLRVGSASSPPLTLYLK